MSPSPFVHEVARLPFLFAKSHEQDGSQSNKSKSHDAKARRRPDSCHKLYTPNIRLLGELAERQTIFCQWEHRFFSLRLNSWAEHILDIYVLPFILHRQSPAY